MHRIRPAGPTDGKAIEQVLDELDYARSQEGCEDFWVALDEGKIVGVAHLAPYEGFDFLSYVGVLSAHRGRGIAKEMLLQILVETDRPVYLYTVIPDFFRRIGFEVTDAPKTIPPRQRCEGCDRGKCVCMVRMP